jgi:hypothetical protein
VGDGEFAQLRMAGKPGRPAGLAVPGDLFGRPCLAAISADEENFGHTGILEQAAGTTKAVPNRNALNSDPLSPNRPAKQPSQPI